jgi:hypothetical protein
LDLQPHDLAQLVTGIVDAFKANAQSKAVDLVTSWNIEGSPVLVLDKISVHKVTQP